MQVARLVHGIEIMGRNATLVNPEHFGALAMRSAEVDTANNALNSGASLKGATFASALIGVTADDLGYGSWVSRLRRWVS